MWYPITLLLGVQLACTMGAKTSYLKKTVIKKSDLQPAMDGDGFEFSLGPPDSGFSIFLADRTKKIHFIRHAEGHHNVLTAQEGTDECLTRGKYKEAKDHPLWDSRLTEEGIKQAENLRDYLATRPSGDKTFTNFDLVVVSPLTRTCETALHIFGVPRAPGKPAFLDQRLAPENTPEFKEGKTIPAPRILVREECRERWGKYVCDGRRSISEISKEFENFDFSEMTEDDDKFYTEERESDEHCCERAVKFLQWLNARPEKNIVVVTHSSFLRHLFGQFGDNLDERYMDTLHRMAGNCELRSVVLCSHGNKEGERIEPLRANVAAKPEINVGVAPDS